MTTPPSRPLPEITLLDEPFWEGTKAHELRLQRCDDCSAYRFTPKEVCPDCASMNATWTAVSGQGTVYSYSAVHRGPGPAFQGDSPYVVVLVQLAEGPRVLSHLVDCAPEQVSIGMPVTVTFEDASDEVAFYNFRPA